jgi:hypothetical protein
MNEIEKHISSIPFPDPTPKMDARVESLLRELGRGAEQTAVPNAVSPASPKQARLTMSLKIGSVAATLLIAAFVFLSSSGSHSPAFADVAQQARTVETLQYLYKQVYMEQLPTGGMSVLSPETGEYEVRTDVKQVTEEAATALESELENISDPTKRSELIKRIEILRAHTQPEQPLLQHSVRVRAARGGRERRECIFPPFVGDTIANATQGSEVSLDSVRKKLFVIKKITVNESGDEEEIESIRNDVIQGILSIPQDAVTRLPSKTIDGQPVMGFRHQVNMNGGRVEKDYWVHPETCLPVQIESRFYDEGAELPAIYSVYWDFVFDEPLDDVMFATDAPAGFTIDEATIEFYAPAETAN